MRKIQPSALAALRDSEERFRATFEQAAVGMSHISLDGTFLNVNQKLCDIVGYTREELIGRAFQDITHPDDLNLNLDMLRRMVEGELQTYVIEKRYVRKDGSVVWVRITASSVCDDAGAPKYSVGVVQDITRSKLAQDQIKKQAALIDLSPDAIIVRDVDGIITFWSKGAEALYGWKAEEVINRQTHELFQTQFTEPLEEIRSKLQSVGRWDGELTHTTRDGRKIIVASRQLLQSDVSESTSTVLETNTDITERKRAEAALRESEYRYRYLADSMPQIVWTARPDGYLDYYNRRWVQYTGMTVEQTEGWGWQPVLHPDDVERCIRRWASSVQTGERYEVEYRFRRASDGSYRWHLGRALPMRDDAGQIVKWFGTSTDIDDQKRAQESLQFMVEASHLLTSSLDYHVILENIARLAVPRVADFCLIDMAGEDGSIERMMVAHADPAKAEEWKEMQRQFPLNPAADYTIPQAIRTGKSVIYEDVTPEKLAAMLDNPEHLAALQKFGIKSSMVVPLVSRGHAIGAITLISADSGRRYTERDVTLAEVLARRAALAIDNAILFGEMQAARHVAEEASRAKDEFLATLSHELRTPLTPIIGWVHMIRSGMLSTDADRAHALDVVERNSQSLTRLINDLLDMSAILSGKMLFDLSPVFVDATIREAIETVRPYAMQHNIHINVSHRNWENWIAVVGDRMRLVQIFWNLLSNALKFSPDGSSVRVMCEATEREVSVCVEDEGQGISADFMPNIFDRFRQADSSKTRAHGGLGLGLALVKSFVEAHGGHVEAASEGAGRGSRFTVRLPRFTDSA
ncbi:MAG TPA: PAS domain S-box protein, partial [Pyrinomonadaceae bacterium]|nr:PAS domain S-box protein [Pyrinomonadaceae bacterium]